MSQSAPRLVYFVVPATEELGRSAVREFNTVAAQWGLHWTATAEPPADPSRVGVVIAIAESASEAALRERFPTARIVESWDRTSPVEVLVSGLIARLLGGTDQSPPPPPPPASKPAPAAKKLPVVKVGRETAGRRGKGVTVVSEVPLNEAGLLELAATLKQRCGTGGTVKDGRIEIQGDHRDRLVVELEKLGYKAKRSGG